MMKYFVGSVLAFLLLAACASSEDAQELIFISPTSSPPIRGTTPIVQELVFTPTQSTTPMQGRTPIVQELDGASQSYAGVTLEVVRVKYASNQTIVDFRVSVDSRWNFTDGEPPQQALVYPSLFDDKGNPIAGRSGTNGLGTFYSDGRASFVGREIFDPALQDNKSLTLKAGPIFLTEIPAEEILELDIGDRELGNAWRLDETLSVGGIPFIITEVRLEQAESVDKQLRLEFITDAPVIIEPLEGTINLHCLYIFESDYSEIELVDTGRSSASCDSQDEVIVAVFEFGPTTRMVESSFSVPQGTIEYNIVAYIMIAGPWEITWPIEMGE